MFLDEARLAARLSHPNIVHTYEVGEQNGVYFIAMEYLEGQSLNKVLKEALRRKEGIEPELGARIIADALGGLAYAHELADYDGRPLGIIHRDVSPHNIFVTYDGHMKVVDFGIAKAALSSTETEVGVLKGKVAYMSPEQAMGGRIDQRADLFAMGIVLWELLARQRLMTGESAANTLHKLMNEPIPRVSAAMPGIDPELEAIVGKALEKDPQYRWQSAAEMRDALEAWLRSNPRPARQEEVGRKMLHLFSSVREEVQRQVQRHMAGDHGGDHDPGAPGAQRRVAQPDGAVGRERQRTAAAPRQRQRLGQRRRSELRNGLASVAGLAAFGRVPGHGHAGIGRRRSRCAAPGARARQQHAAHRRSPWASSLLAGLLIIVVGLRDRRKPDGPVADPTSTAATGTVVAVNGSAPAVRRQRRSGRHHEPDRLRPPTARPRHRTVPTSATVAKTNVRLRRASDHEDRRSRASAASASAAGRGEGAGLPDDQRLPVGQGLRGRTRALRRDAVQQDPALAGRAHADARQPRAGHEADDVRHHQERRDDDARDWLQVAKTTRKAQ